MRTLKLIIILLTCLYLSGCSRELTSEVKAYKARYAKQRVVIDGKLDDDIWQQTPSYPMYLSKNKIEQGEILQETGKVRFAWDDDYFYVAADFQDSDIVAQGREDQMHHYKYGDLCELFLKPTNESYYWELYVTPADKKSSFFYPSRSYLGLPDCLEKYTCGLTVTAECNGTLNDWQQKDDRWMAEMAMPIKDLEAYGYKFSSGWRWTILVGRYNYSRDLNQTELSMTPQLSRTFFHIYEEYGILELIR
jgi:hypothetical protein